MEPDPAHQPDIAGAPLRPGLAVAERAAVGVRTSLPGDVGRDALRRFDRRPLRAGALRRPATCGAAFDRAAGPEPVGSKAHRRLADRIAQAGAAAARGSARPEDPARGGGVAGHRRLHAQPGRRSHRRHGNARDGRQLRHRRAPRRVLPGPEGHWPGDAIELETLQGKEVYHVERVWVVYPEEVSVLDATPTRSLTLVTCYPFYHVGPAPQRYIVRAVTARVSASGCHFAPLKLAVMIRLAVIRRSTGRSNRLTCVEARGTRRRKSEEAL